MVTSLLRYERITTTKAKALEVRKAAEKIITRSKVDTVHNRRQAARFIQDKIILAKLFTNIGPRMKDRPGGYTRILKLGYRAGDAADIVILELVDYELKDKSAEKDKKSKTASAPRKAAKPKGEAKKAPREAKDGEAKKAPKEKAKKDDGKEGEKKPPKAKTAAKKDQPARAKKPAVPAAEGAEKASVESAPQDQA
jgi:large subunit ribosomal protein L17